MGKKIIIGIISIITRKTVEEFSNSPRSRNVEAVEKGFQGSVFNPKVCIIYAVSLSNGHECSHIVGTGTHGENSNFTSSPALRVGTAPTGHSSFFLLDVCVRACRHACTHPRKGSGPQGFIWIQKGGTGLQDCSWGEFSERGGWEKGSNSFQYVLRLATGRETPLLGYKTNNHWGNRHFIRL